MTPTILRTTEEMLKLVPRNLREGSLALGASNWKTSFQILLPAALNGIVTGFLLALARAAGETAPLSFTALGNDRFDLKTILISGTSGAEILTGATVQVDHFLGKPYPREELASLARRLLGG